MDELTSHIQEEALWCMLFVDDIGLVINESTDGVNAKLQGWRKALESKGFKISSKNTEYMDCNFSGNIERSKTTVRIEDREIPK